MHVFKWARNAALFLCLDMAGNAWATDYTFNLGAWNPGTPYTQIVDHVLPLEPVGTSFVDLFNFQIARGSATSSVAVNLNLQPFLSIDNLQLSLYSGANALGNLLDGPVGSGVTLTANLPTNTDYSLKVTGRTSGSLGGSYSTAIAVVPEAQSWPMMLVGLGMVSLAWQRKRISDAAGKP